MSRIFMDDRWFDGISPARHYESEYETIVRQHAGQLFEHYHLVTFKKSVESEHGAVIPDLALVGHDYSDWIVIEVEMAVHSFSSHVEPQLIKLLMGDYTQAHARHLSENHEQLEYNRLSDMVKGEQPEILIVVNYPVPRWREKIDAHGGRVLVFQPFVSDRNRYSFLVDGFLPEPDSEIVSRCRRDPAVPKMLLVERPGTLPIDDEEACRILYRNSVTRWRRVDGRERVWLAPTGPFPLEGEGPFELRRDDERLRFEHPS